MQSNWDPHFVLIHGINISCHFEQSKTCTTIPKYRHSLSKKWVLFFMFLKLIFIKTFQSIWSMSCKKSVAILGYSNISTSASFLSYFSLLGYLPISFSILLDPHECVFSCISIYVCKSYIMHCETPFDWFPWIYA